MGKMGKDRVSNSSNDKNCMGNVWEIYGINRDIMGYEWNIHGDIGCDGRYIYS